MRMTIPAAISLVTLGVRDVGAATDFYRALGFPLSSASVPGVVSFFRTAGGLLGLFGADDLADDAQLPHGAQDAFRGVTLAINVPDRTAVDSAIGAAEAAGARVVKPAQATDWGGYHAYFADPDGHVWEVAHNPGWPLDDAGLPVLPN
jgi:catechol 2,3-dioxygenase-like lactoylglutathione lyase family enzyme